MTPGDDGLVRRRMAWSMEKEKDVGSK